MSDHEEYEYGYNGEILVSSEYTIDFKDRYDSSLRVTFDVRPNLGSEIHLTFNDVEFKNDATTYMSYNELCELIDVLNKVKNEFEKP